MPPSLRVAGLILVLALVGGLSAQSRGERDRLEPPRSEAEEDDPPGGAFQPSGETRKDRPANRPDLAKARPRGEPSDRSELPPLFPKGRSERGREPGGPVRSTRPQGLVPVVGSLALVLGLFFVVAWMMRRTIPAANLVLPGEVLEVLGRAPLAGRQQVHLVRLGNKLVLVSVTPAGMEALSEVTDPDEVERLTGLCRQAQPNSSTAMFRRVLQQFSGEHEQRRRRGGAAGGLDGEETTEASDV